LVSIWRETNLRLNGTKLTKIETKLSKVIENND